MSGNRLKASISPSSKTQQWFRNYAKNLLTSYNSSGLIEHKVTKGESRERQIFDVLDTLLPNRISLKKDVVIIDSLDIQSPKFDGVLLDRDFWPLLFQEHDTTVAMIESVLAAFEVKSSLDKNDLKDIFSKAEKLRSMKCMSGSFISPPLVTAFAYGCSNIKLAFFDFSLYSQKVLNLNPSHICILNQALFGLSKIDELVLSPTCQPGADHIPIMFLTREDTLLTYIYLLSSLATVGCDTVDIFKKYSSRAFSDLVAFHFDRDFLLKIAKDNDSLNKARTCFKRHSNIGIEDTYKIARTQIGLT